MTDKALVGECVGKAKSGLSNQNLLFLHCPECGSQRLYKDGWRVLADGSETQRYLCRCCGHRFSKSQSLNYRMPMNLNSKFGPSGSSSLTGNLDHVTETKTIAGEKSCQDTEGLVTQFLAYLEREGYDQGTRYHYLIRRLVRQGANLLNPDSIKETIGRLKIKDGTKLQYVYAYNAFTKMLKISWELPKYTQEENLPFIPEEKELDALIASCRSKRMAAYLQCLKETYADPGEALKLRWIDITGNIITINHPVKGHLPRQLEVSNKLISMLNALPKASERIFPTTYMTMFRCFEAVRKKAAELQKNPRLLSIQLRTFRHWGGTMIAHYTNGNVLTVKKLLGHKRVENTMKYIGMIHFKDNEFEVTTATTVDEAKQILSAGFDYITEKNGIMLFRRPKRFSKNM